MSSDNVLRNNSLTSENLLFCLHNLSELGHHIHGFKFSAGLYLMKDGIKVISINPVISYSIFWGIPVMKNNIIASGVNTYEELDIIEEIQKPKNITFDIDYTCDLHKLHKYWYCDKCNVLIRSVKILFNNDNKDFCQECFEDDLEGYNKIVCTCDMVYNEE